MRLSAAVVLLVLLPGCLGRTLHRLLPDVPDFGVRATSLHRHGPGVAYVVATAMPGRKAAKACVPDTTAREARPRLQILDCAGDTAADKARLAAALARAAEDLESRFADIGIETVTIRLLPNAVEHVEINRERTSPRALRITLAFRTLAGSEAPLRFAVRAFVHEATHLAIQAGGRMGIATQEYIARVAETCVEHAVFGDSRAHVHPEELLQPDMRRFGRAVGLSIRATGLAYRDVRPLLQALERSEAGAAQRFARFCAGTLDLTRAREAGRLHAPQS